MHNRQSDLEGGKGSWRGVETGPVTALGLASLHSWSLVRLGCHFVRRKEGNAIFFPLLPKFECFKANDPQKKRYLP